MKEKLKVGEYYRMRDGRRVKIEKIETSSDWVIGTVDGGAKNGIAWLNRDWTTPKDCLYSYIQDKNPYDIMAPWESPSVMNFHHFVVGQVWKIRKPARTVDLKDQMVTLSHVRITWVGEMVEGYYCDAAGKFLDNQNSHWYVSRFHDGRRYLESDNDRDFVTFMGMVVGEAFFPAKGSMDQPGVNEYDQPRHAPTDDCECKMKKFNFTSHERWCPDFIDFRTLTAMAAKAEEIKRNPAHGYMTEGDLRAKQR